MDLKLCISMNESAGTNLAISGAPKYIGITPATKQSMIFSVMQPGYDVFSKQIANL